MPVLELLVSKSRKRVKKRQQDAGMIRRSRILDAESYTVRSSQYNSPRNFLRVSDRGMYANFRFVFIGTHDYILHFNCEDLAPTRL